MGQPPESAIGRMNAFVRRHAVPALAFGVGATLVAGETAVAANHDGQQTIAVQHEPIHQSHHRHPAHTLSEAAASPANFRPESVVLTHANVPIATYSGALMVSHGNVVAADRELITAGIPPVPTDTLKTLDSSLHLHLGGDQMAVAGEIDNQWQSVASTNHIRMAKKPVEAMYGSMDKHQQWQVRHHIKEVMDEEYARDVHEQPWGSNRGPRIDYYNRYHLLHKILKTVPSREWCGTADSTEYNLADTPLSGGKTYTKHTPDYLLSQAYGPLDPDAPHPVVSVADWFKKYANYFRRGEGTPQVGDAYFKRYPLINQRTGKPVRNKHGKIEYEYHTGIVYAVEGSTLITQDGNVDNQLERVPHYDYLNDSSLVGFGSFFPRLAAHQPKKPTKPSPSPTPAGPIQTLLDDIQKLLPPHH